MHTNDLNRDELRRTVRDAERAHREAMPHLRDVLRRLFHPESPERDLLTLEQKAEVLGVRVPTRRTFLRTGGLALVGAAAAAVAACGDDGDSSATATAPTGPTTTVPELLEPTDDDLLLAVATAQIEHTAIAAYDAALTARSDDLRAMGLTDLAVAFRDHHTEHAAAVNAILVESGQAAEPPDSQYQRAPQLAPAELATVPVAQLVASLRGLEDQATQTYITAVPLLTLPELRRSLLSIGAVEARHVAAIDMVLGQGLGGYATTEALVVGGNYPTNESFLTT